MAKVANKVKDSAGVTFKFLDKAGTTISCGLNDLPEHIVTALAVHGLSQKVGDSYASAQSVAEAIGNAQEVWKNLVAGNFNVRNSTGGILAEAVARIKGIAVEEAFTVLEALDEDKIDALKKNERVKATIAVIKGERAAAKAVSSGDDDLGI